MALSVVLTMVAVLLTSSNSSPIENKTPSGYEVKNGSLWDNFCFDKPKGYDEIERMFQDLLPSFTQNIDNVHKNWSSDDTFSPDYLENDNCPYKATWESVYCHREPNQTNLDIIVQAKAFPQKLLKVQCKHTDGAPGLGGKCFTSLGFDNFEKQFQCRETIATRSLVLYDPETHKLKMKDYSIPVCCSCRAVRL
ncbi:uncharacterized protein LOC124631905 [Helicoverpa zea]|uniref:uncharacterized protein LOC124631905 n=1 Tax=Helicoverpa zea TaxID=7113 RepID=UPI001F5842A1|nr:uncharacterized protein LOC124631905 [Helicoverpa zea]